MPSNDQPAAQPRGDIPPDPPNPRGKPTEPSAAYTPLRWPWYATFRSEGFVGVRVRRLYVTLRSPEHKPLFSERNRIKCRTLHLPGTDWRIVARWDRAV